MTNILHTFKHWLAVAISLIVVFAATQTYAAETESTPAVNARIDDFAVGKKAIENKQWQQAVESFSKVVANDPKHADAHNLLGFSYRWLGKYPEAFAAYGKALALDPKHKGALHYSGIAYLKTGQKAKAEEQLEQLRTVCSNCDETLSLAKAISEAK